MANLLCLRYIDQLLHELSNFIKGYRPLLLTDKIIDDTVKEFQEDIVRMKSLERIMDGSLLDTYQECTMLEIRTRIDSAICDEINTAFKDSEWWTAWYKGYYYSNVEAWHVDESWGTNIRSVVMDKLNIDCYAE